MKSYSKCIDDVTRRASSLKFFLVMHLVLLKYFITKLFIICTWLIFCLLVVSTSRNAHSNEDIIFTGERTAKIRPIFGKHGHVISLACH